MKRILSISLTLLLLFSTIGVTVHKHYCGSTLVGTSILPHGDDGCGTEMPMEGKDCTDSHQHFSVESPLVLLSLTIELTPSFELFDSLESLASNLTQENLNFQNQHADILPYPTEPNIYIKVQSFLL